MIRPPAFRSPPHRRPPVASAGVTLVELLVTLAVLAIVLALGAPQLGSFLTNRAVVAHTSLFASDLRFARSEALKRGQTVTLCAAATITPPACTNAPGDAGFANGWIVFADPNANGTIDDTDTVLRIQQPVTDRMASITSGQYAFSFVNIGITLSGAANLTFTPKGSSQDVTAYSRAVCVARTGRAKVMPAGQTGERACGN